MNFYGLIVFFGFICFAYSLPQLRPDQAQDPNSVDDDIGWSWGVSDTNDDNRNVNNQVNMGSSNVNRRPQSPQGPQVPLPQNPPIPQRPGTTLPPGVTEAPSESFLRCFDACPTTSQYSPVCGSDQQSYHNMAKFDCAVACGANIQVLFVGTCVPISG
ncbi:uncharacterized protein LOC129801738 [Phlebotomus papatasi]|uniref:uncharacterized protein LOC129801738 n=1 Tax=Phlebotomus papatasi TaxID=29031 RepID=UPI002483D415|nr:uncharacterized protein LOC129801738 [Phlebotomus papatasi]